MNLEKDFLASKLLCQGVIPYQIRDVINSADIYDYIYYQTNENLINPILDVDFNGKDVLSVLASSDQVFTARFLDAKSVEAFDKNILTLYYYYLRIWSIKYKQELYPDVLDDYDFKYNDTNKWLEHLLKLIVPTTNEEEIALQFFKKFINNNISLNDLFDSHCTKPKGDTLFESASDLENCLGPLKFYNIDMFHLNKFVKTYDIVLMSNIIEWARRYNQSPTTIYENICNNLVRALKPGGVVICSRLTTDSPLEQYVFRNDFYTELYDSAHIHIKK